jgi:hypothetical protein
MTSWAGAYKDMRLVSAVCSALYELAAGDSICIWAQFLNQLLPAVRQHLKSSHRCCGDSLWKLEKMMYTPIRGNVWLLLFGIQAWVTCESWNNSTLMNCSNKKNRLPDCHSYHRGGLLSGVVRGQICVILIACFATHVLSVREVLSNSMCFFACLWSVFLFQSMSLRSVQTVPHNVGYLSSLHINPWCFIVFCTVHVEGNLIVLSF